MDTAQTVLTQGASVQKAQTVWPWIAVAALGLVLVIMLLKRKK